VRDEFVAQLSGEESRFDLTHHDVATSVGDREQAQWCRVDRDAGDVGHEAAESIGEQRRLRRRLGDEGDELAAMKRDAADAVSDGIDAGGPEQGSVRFDDQRLDIQDAKNASGADVGARRGDHVLDRRAKRCREERRVAKKRDELSRREGPVHHVLGTEVGHDARQDRGQQHLARFQTGLGRRDAIARESHDVALSFVVVEEDLLTAHAAKDAQSGDRVGAECGEAAGRFALGGLSRVQGPHQRRRE